MTRFFVGVMEYFDAFVLFPTHLMVAQTSSRALHCQCGRFFVILPLVSNHESLSEALEKSNRDKRLYQGRLFVCSSKTSHCLLLGRVEIRILQKKKKNLFLLPYFCCTFDIFAKQSGIINIYIYL